jgi:hypothetical protein
MDTKLYLFRDLRDTAPRWHSVGPHHERLSLNLIDLVGYAGKNCANHPPYHLYNAGGYDTDHAHLPLPAIDQSVEYATAEDARAAGEAYALRWIEAAGNAPVIWTANKTGVHWQANADGVHIGNYYYSTGRKHRMPDGTLWHKGFRVWFGGTYYIIDFASPKEARARVEATWREWMAHAKSLLLANAKVSNAHGNEAQ